MSTGQPNQEAYNLLLTKNKTLSEQCIRTQQELGTLSSQFQEFKAVQENIALVLTHRHHAELETWQSKCAILEKNIEHLKTTATNPLHSDDTTLIGQNNILQQQINELQIRYEETQRNLIAEQNRTKQTVQLYLQTQAQLTALKDKYESQQLTEANLAHLIKLQQQIDEQVLQQAQKIANNEIKSTGEEQYPTAVLLLQEIQLLKAQHKRDTEQLAIYNVQVQQMTDEIGKLNGSIVLHNNSSSNNEQIQLLEDDLATANQHIEKLEHDQQQYIQQITTLQSTTDELTIELKSSNDKYEQLLTSLQSFKQELQVTQQSSTTSLEQDLAKLSLSAIASVEGNNNNNNNISTSSQNSNAIAELEELQIKHKKQLDLMTAQVQQLQSEINTLQTHNDELVIDIQNSKSTIDNLTTQNNQLGTTLEELIENKQNLASTANTQIKAVIEAMNIARQEREQYRQQVVDKDAMILKIQIKFQQEMAEQRHQQIGHYITALQDVQNELTNFREELMSIRDYISSLTTTTNNNDNDVSKNNILTVVKQYVKEQNEQLTFLKQRYDQEVKLRKSVFNQLQELKGNIRVYARLRPISQAEKAIQGDAQPVQCISDGELRIIQEKDGKKTTFPFEFEKVFAPNSTQEQVFEEVKDLIMSCLDGFNVCIFAYGQTGTGKTFTMEGAANNLRGVNPRALQMLFDYTSSTSDEWEWNIKLTMVEIYNEKVQDLLRTDNSGDINLKIVPGKDGKNEVQGCNVVPVTSAQEVESYLAKGKKNRHMSATAMNAESSRSHLVVTIYTHGYNRLTKVVSTGRLNLIDLAGSERISRSGVTGEGLKEAQNINASLSNLGNVIAARANKQAHIPYRGSQLTMLLQDSLDKNSKTLMIVQLSPTIESVGETLCSLRFAARVKEVELGKATAAKSVSKE